MRYPVLAETILDVRFVFQVRERSIRMVGIMNGYTLSGAVFSDDHSKRYTLWRVWDDTLPAMVVIMLNPSTADGDTDDPTIRRCVSFARREGCGMLGVVNLFTLCGSDPGCLSRWCHAYENAADITIKLATWMAEPPPKLAVCAWGNHGHTHGRQAQVLNNFPKSQELWCFGVTKQGCPKHPLYLAKDTPLVPFEWSARAWNS